MENTLLNLIPSSYIPEVHLSQYDVGRELTFKLMDGNTEYSVPSGAVVTVKATKPSGLGFVVSGTFSGNIVTIVNTETMTNESGRFSAELSISSGAILLGTSNFIFNIERSPHPEGTTDGDAETLIPELTLLVNEIRESNAKVESMTASASPLPSGSNPTAEYDPDTNNLAFGIPVPEVTEEDLYKAFITKSASGEIASFSDGGDDLPMKSLKVNIAPKQSGSGDPSPSNVRPISGTDTVWVNVTGKNLLPQPLESGAYATANGNPVASGSYIRSKKFYLPAGTYYISTQYCSAITMLMWNGDTYDGHFENYPSRPIFVLAEGRTVAFNFFKSEGITVADEPTVQLELGSTATDYEPYEGETITTNLGQTVYGGTLDVVSGKLTVNKAFVDMGTLNWSYQTNIKCFCVAPLSNMVRLAGNNVMANWICSRYTVHTMNQIRADEGTINVGIAQGYSTVTGASSILVRDDTYSSASAFKTAMNGVQLVYELATPTEIQLTPTEVKTLLGSNNIWSESGTVEVEYRADTTLAYEELANAIISLGGNI